MFLKRGIYGYIQCIYGPFSVRIIPYYLAQKYEPFCIRIFLFFSVSSLSFFFSMHVRIGSSMELFELNMAYRWHNERKEKKILHYHDSYGRDNSNEKKYPVNEQMKLEEN